MGNTSKDLLHLEHKHNNHYPSTSPLESTLLVCKKDSFPQPQIPIPDAKPVTAPVPKAKDKLKHYRHYSNNRRNVLGKVKDFLGVISEANERLQDGAKDNSENYNIEVLTGNESEVIEMDLMLDIADLHTPEAVAAAESAIAGCHPVIPLAASNSGTDSEDSSDNDSDDDDGEACLPVNLKRSKSSQDHSLSEDVNQSEKRQKIVELS